MVGAHVLIRSNLSWFLQLAPSTPHFRSIAHGLIWLVGWLIRKLCRYTHHCLRTISAHIHEYARTVNTEALVSSTVELLYHRAVKPSWQDQDVLFWWRKPRAPRFTRDAWRGVCILQKRVTAWCMVSFPKICTYKVFWAQFCTQRGTP